LYGEKCVVFTKTASIADVPVNAKHRFWLLNSEAIVEFVNALNDDNLRTSIDTGASRLCMEVCTSITNALEKRPSARGDDI